MPKICSPQYAANPETFCTFPECMYARPADVPIQRTPDEPNRRQFTLSEGKPSPFRNALHRPWLRESIPLGVANHIVPLEYSALAAAAPEALPSAVVSDVKVPCFK